MKVEKAVQFMIDVANDDKHGYSQMNRQGNPDYDCSSLVVTAYEKAGFPVTSKYGATYTGNMKRAFLRCGFTDVKKSVNIQTGQGLKRGDILLNESYHVAVYTGNNQMVHARMDERGGIHGRQKGDQTGQEISITPYYLYRKGWDCVLRYEEKLDENILDKKEIKMLNEKEKFYGTEAINKLAELGLVNNPSYHIQNLSNDNLTLWVMNARLAEELKKLENKLK